ncbi:MAG: M56 family metallopeptidase [Clostridiales bacterium]|nr:M56 family metallopeptidase [Clostridiales bacterium]
MFNILFCSINMTLVTLLYMLISRATKGHQSPAVRYYTWVIIAIGFLIPIRPVVGRSAISIDTKHYETTPLMGTGNSVATPSLSQILLVIYIIGIIAGIAVFIVKTCLWHRTLRRLALPAFSDMEKTADDIRAELGIGSVSIMIVPGISTPMMTGLTKPTVFLPNRDYEDDELRLIIKHELTHFKHHDLWVKLIVTACRALHWFNPVMIPLIRNLEQECELYCDMSVMAEEPREARKLYCESILNAVSSQSTVKQPVLATNFYSPKQNLKHRLQLIMGMNLHAFAGILIAVSILCAVCGIIVNANAQDRYDGRDTDSPEVTESYMPLDYDTDGAFDEVEETTYWDVEHSEPEGGDYSAATTFDEVEETTYWREEPESSLPTTVTEVTTTMTE